MSRFPIFPVLWTFAASSVLALGYRGQRTATAQPDVPLPSVQHASPAGHAGTSPARQGPDVRPAPAPQPQQILKDAVRTLESRRSVAAKIRFEGDLFGKRVIGSGSYLELRHGPNRLTRLELRSQVGNQTGSLVEVCDGLVLWRCRNLSGNVKLSRIDVDEANRGLQQARAARKQEKMGMLPGLGGLPRLLRGLDASFDFISAERGRWGQLPVWQIRGRWKPEVLAEVLPDQEEAIEQGKPPDLSKLPEHLPDEVVLLLGMEPPDRFLYCIEYRRAIPKRAFRSDALQSRTLMKMQLFDVMLDGPIDTDRFLYSPPDDVECTDETESFLESLGVTD